MTRPKPSKCKSRTSRFAYSSSCYWTIASSKLSRSKWCPKFCSCLLLTKWSWQRGSFVDENSYCVAKEESTVVLFQLLLSWWVFFASCLFLCWATWRIGWCSHIFIMIWVGENMLLLFHFSNLQWDFTQFPIEKIGILKPFRLYDYLECIFITYPLEAVVENFDQTKDLRRSK